MILFFCESVGSVRFSQKPIQEMPAHITTTLSIILFVAIKNAFARISKAKPITFNREYGFNLTTSELSQDLTFSTSDDVFELKSGAPEDIGVNYVHENDLLVSIDHGNSVNPTEVADALKELDALLLFLRNAKGASTIFPRFSENSNLEGFVEMRWIDAKYVQIQPKEKKRQDEIRDVRNEEAARKAEQP